MLDRSLEYRQPAWLSQKFHELQIFFNIFVTLANFSPSVIVRWAPGQCRRDKDAAGRAGHRPAALPRRARHPGGRSRAPQPRQYWSLDGAGRAGWAARAGARVCQLRGHPLDNAATLHDLAKHHGTVRRACAASSGATVPPNHQSVDRTDAVLPRDKQAEKSASIRMRIRGRDVEENAALFCRDQVVNNLECRGASISFDVGRSSSSSRPPGLSLCLFGSSAPVAFEESDLSRHCPAITPSWRRAWNEVIPFLDYPPEARWLADLCAHFRGELPFPTRICARAANVPKPKA